MNTQITFTNEGEVVLIMDQTPNNRLPVKQFVFTLRSGDGRMLGTLAPELTHGYGYARAIGHVGKALLQLFPNLRLDIVSFHSNGQNNLFTWTTSDIEDCVDKLRRS